MSNHRTPFERRDCGTALFFVLALLMVLMISSGTFYSLLHSTMSQGKHEQQSQVCLNLAEGGIDKALAALRAKNLDYAGEQDTPLGDGFFSVEVRPGDRTDVQRIVSNGFLREGTVVLAKACVTMDVALSPDGAIREIFWRKTP